MADLSEHLGPVGEFFLGLAGFLLLLSMHPPFRHWVQRQFVRGASRVAQIYNAADARSESLHRWTIAFRMLFRDRRGLLAVIAGLILFDYALIGYQYLVHLIAVGPNIGQTHWNQPHPVELSVFYIVSTRLLNFVSLALFGWLALRYARGDDWEAASRFKPYALVAAAFCCFAGLVYASLYFQSLLSYLVLLGHFFPNQQEAYLLVVHIAAPLLAASLIGIAGAFMLVRAHAKRVYSVLFSGFVGFVAIVQFVSWLRWSSHKHSFRNGDNWLNDLLFYVADFTDTALWNIAFVAFVVVLAAPGERKSAAT